MRIQDESSGNRRDLRFEFGQAGIPALAIFDEVRNAVTIGVSVRVVYERIQTVFLLPPIRHSIGIRICGN